MSENKSSIIDKLIEKRNRRVFAASEGFSYECRFLSNQFLELKLPSEQQNFYFVVSFITNAESCFRYLIAEIIEHSPDNLHLVSNMIDDNLGKRELIDSILAIGSKRASVSEIVSHAIPISSIEQVSKYFNFLTGGKTRNFLDKIKETESFVKEFPGFDLDFAFESMRALFKIRHILCHENSMYDEVCQEELSEYFFHASGLIYLFKTMKDSLLNIPEFKSQADMQEFAYGELNKLKNETDKLIDDICHELSVFEEAYQTLPSYKKGEFETKLRDSQKKWDEFKIADAEAVVTQVWGGSAMGLQSAAHLKLLTEQRLSSLKESWKNFSGDMNKLK